MLQGEMDVHLGYPKNGSRSLDNARNGTTTKRVKPQYGQSEIIVPRDRNSGFEPIIVPKHKSTSLSVENIVISLYAKGMSVSNIEEELYEIYGYKLSTSSISLITDRINQEVIEWQNKPLETVYCVAW